MSTATYAGSGIDLRALASAFAPGPVRFDPLGLVSGYKAYSIYTALTSKSDAELARLGLEREDLPRAAMDAATTLRA